MRKILASLFFACFIFTQSFSLDVSVGYATFSSIDKSYMEVYLHMVGATMKAIPIENSDTFSAQAEVLIFIKQNEEIVQYEKYLLNSPAFKEAIDFQDLKRWSLDEGVYVLEVQIKDANDASAKTVSYKDDFTVVRHDDLALSDIQLVASASPIESESVFTKNGYDLEILPFEYLDSKYSSLIFYNEVYNSDKSDNEFFVSYTINSGYVGEVNKEVKKGFKKIIKSSIYPILQDVDISNVPSGNYHLIVELYDRDKNKIASSSKNFRRNNPMTDIELAQVENEVFENSFVQDLDEEKLNYYLKALAPIINSNKNSILNSVVSSDNMQSKRYFLYAHWIEESSEYAEETFKEYMKVADAIHAMYYSAFGYGFETDRGHIYLKYGRPTNSVTITDEPSAPPYEMWVYDQIASTQQTNVKFVFYNPSLSHNDFEILHSTCRGEYFNPAWEIELYRDAISENNNKNIDAISVKDNIYRNAKRLFEDL